MDLREPVVARLAEPHAPRRIAAVRRKKDARACGAAEEAGGIGRRGAAGAREHTDDEQRKREEARRAEPIVAPGTRKAASHVASSNPACRFAFVSNVLEVASVRSSWCGIPRTGYRPPAPAEGKLSLRTAPAAQLSRVEARRTSSPPHKLKYLRPDGRAIAFQLDLELKARYYSLRSVLIAI
jgi:hypothetical protein